MGVLGKRYDSPLIKRSIIKETNMPVVTKIEYALGKGKKSEGKMPGRKKGEGGSKFPSMPKSRDGKFEGTTGGQSKSLPQM